MNNLDDVRYAYFQQHYAHKGNDYILGEIKDTNRCSMPSCKGCLTGEYSFKIPKSSEIYLSFTAKD